MSTEFVFCPAFLKNGSKEPEGVQGKSGFSEQKRSRRDSLATQTLIVPHSHAIQAGEWLLVYRGLARSESSCSVCYLGSYRLLLKNYLVSLRSIGAS